MFVCLNVKGGRVCAGGSSVVGLVQNTNKNKFKRCFLETSVFQIIFLMSICEGRKKTFKN